MITSKDAVINGKTRRNFGRLAPVEVMAASLPHHASGKLDVGIGTYSYHALTVDDMIDQLRALNIAEIEMSLGEFMLMNHPGDELFRSVRAKLDRSGIRCRSYYRWTIKVDQDLENALCFAKILGAQNISGDATGSILTRIDQRCSQEGLT